MNHQLRGILGELQAAMAGFAALAAAAPGAVWHRRPAAGSWSAAECLAHLNLTSEAYLPILRSGVARAREIGGAAPARYRRDPVGWLLWRMMGPPVRFRSRTTAVFVPSGEQAVRDLLDRFNDLQADLAAAVRQADELPIQRVRIASPFDARVRYNLFSAMSILPRHQLRHLWQAERTISTLAAGARDGTEPASAPGADTHPNPEVETMQRKSGNSEKDERGTGGFGEAPEPREGESSAQRREGAVPGEGPRAPAGDALLEGKGTRHGVDARDERPGEGG